MSKDHLVIAYAGVMQLSSKLRVKNYQQNYSIKQRKKSSIELSIYENQVKLIESAPFQLKWKEEKFKMPKHLLNLW